MKSTEIPFLMFQAFFHASIRIQLNWQRLKIEKITVKITVFDQLENPSAWYLPWYFNNLYEEVSYLESNANPLTLADIPKAINRLDSGRRDKIQELLNEFINTTQQPVQLVIATYALPNGKHLIMDGNHRSSALILAGVKARLMVFEICGPIDKELIPDLCHWKN
ncbi:hypothetical protein PCC9214_04051 [Planktothrix tepida]|uniref:ParB/Sulfiredoxin domain-containing protein n=1 Tax=Planktothrix tepida PCC 9214 TaxID=671072 RepID=A0A1J1LP63_9CYAN|nr:MULTISPECIES: hypothetical protein [Planktothrix]MBD2481192.1 hypothetical protein [Planktothrix sp. FACHB-1365]CAD5974447.1 hypothetical protein PCC9214_04051 [Planktothrix tepida]CUR34352.1 conserved hypothetical protein [Planktothrix tepida PCC 9214]